MDVRQAERIRYFACTRKQRFAYGGDAVEAAARLNADPERRHNVRRYRCCFGSDHYHVGGVPSMRSVARLALAIRVLGQGVPIRGTARR